MAGAFNLAENTCALSRDKRYVEEMHYQIAERYIKPGQILQCPDHLLKLKGINDFPTDLQYFFYPWAIPMRINGAKMKPSQIIQKASPAQILPIGLSIEYRLLEIRSRYVPPSIGASSIPIVNCSCSEKLTSEP